MMIDLTDPHADSICKTLTPPPGSGIQGKWVKRYGIAKVEWLTDEVCIRGV
ncbi:hypothetical protein GNZ12_04280 [Paraburkholderia sp. 1N]|uniref:Uncharacterized protein n=1 Tax=Paraburkholderia solitsugae TaxID=2675748 RepID=A0ABX2BHW4_9BURK|nr:hypothetical protein [Paraburkholderia solitsugae]NPT40539.1 hypothetical protein [Paraburkholderia solitsugae]